MKKALLILLLGSATTLTVGQNITNWQLTKIGFGINGIEDLLHGDINEVAEALNAKPEDHPEFTLEDDHYSKIASGGGFKANFSFSPLSKKDGHRNLNQSLDFGLAMNFDKELMVTYSNGGIYCDSLYRSVSYCDYYTELNFTIGYFIQTNPSRMFSLIGGIQGDVSTSVGNKRVLLTYGEMGSQRLNPERNASTQATRVGLTGGIEVKPGARLSFRILFNKGFGTMNTPTKNFNISSWALNVGTVYYLNDMFHMRNDRREMKKNTPRLSQK